MSARIPDDAFAYYVALGADRSYQAVADHFGVSKRGVVNAAAREGWQDRLEAIEASTRERVDQKLGETLEEMRLRHLKLLRGMAGRAARALQQFELNSAMEGMRAAEMVIKLERIVAGEATERSQLTVEQITRQEVDRLLVREDEEPNEESPSDAEGTSDDRTDAGTEEDW